MRWPLLQGQVRRLSVRMYRQVLQIPLTLRQGFEDLQRESELARLRELRSAGLAE